MGVKKKIVVLTGAGISVESGIPAFRSGTDALWNGYNVDEVATPEGWDRNPELVQEFYNARRKDVRKVEPNAAHKALAELEKKYDVQIITTNIDDLHERGGSSKVLHLHGEILKAQSSCDPEDIYDIEGDEIKMGDLCKEGTQKRPHVVWFGEQVPNLDKAYNITCDADIFILCGTSLSVYPAAFILNYVHHDAPKYVVDINIPESLPLGFTKIEAPATEGISTLVKNLMAE